MPNAKAYKQAYPNGYDVPYEWSPSSDKSVTKRIKGGMAHGTYLTMGLVFLVGAIVGGAVAALCLKGSGGYTEIKG